MQELKSGIYCINNIINNKKYIGQSINLKQRWQKHKYELNNCTHFNDYLQKSWNKYGEESFEFLVLEYCDLESLNKKEKYYIEKYNTMDRDLGYNLKSGGQDHTVYSAETKKKLSDSIKKSYEDPKRREIQRINALNQWADEKIREKISGKNNYMYGKTHTEEAKRKISEANRGRISCRRNHTPVLCEELDKKFLDAATAGKELSLDSSGILKVCRGERKTCGGYHWNFIELENNIS